MKKVITVLLMAVAFAASAQETAPAPPASKDDWKTKCEKVGNLAKLVMEARLVGVSMSEMMNGVKSSTTQTMIIEAFESPRYRTPEAQRNAIGEFRDKWYAACVKMLREE